MDYVYNKNDYLVGVFSLSSCFWSSDDNMSIFWEYNHGGNFLKKKLLQKTQVEQTCCKWMFFIRASSKALCIFLLTSAIVSSLEGVLAHWTSLIGDILLCEEAERWGEERAWSEWCQIKFIITHNNIQYTNTSRKIIIFSCMNNYI